MNSTEEEDYSFDFNPHEGFFTTYNSDNFNSFHCDFTRKGLSERYTFGLEVDRKC